MTQFRVLFREFLFRTVDLDLLAPGADTTQLLGQIASFLIIAGIGIAVPAMGIADLRNLPPQFSMLITFSGEHFLIATTMLATGIIAVLSWDSTYPNRRDIFVLAPLPVPPRTIFLAKIAAVAATMTLAVLALHFAAGVLWPVALHAQAKGGSALALTYDAPLPRPSGDRLVAILNDDMARAATLGPGAGAVIGFVDHGKRHVLAYGAAHPDSIFELGSISKTFTALILARMSLQHDLQLGETVAPGSNITFTDIATHHSGLPYMPDNNHPSDWSKPYEEYHDAQLHEWIAQHGLKKPSRRIDFEYSNTGYSILGDTLAHRAGIPFAQLLQREITGPLQLSSTAINLTDAQNARFLPGHTMSLKIQPHWDMDALAPAGGIRSSADDLLTFLDTQLHPDRFAGIAETHRVRDHVTRETMIALAWIRNADGMYWHDGGTAGFCSYAFFDPTLDQAAIVLVNQSPGLAPLANLIGEHVRERMTGQPALSLKPVIVPATTGFRGFLRMFAAYWITMFASAAFIYGAVLALQGLAAQILPQRWFLRASSILQLATFVVLVAGYVLQPIVVTPARILSTQNHGLLFWSPSYWFLGWMQQLNGSPALAPLAAHAWIASATVLAAVILCYGLSYIRTMRRIVECPDIAPSSHGALALPSLGGRFETAVVHFSVRTLLRSRRHRLILAFYWGVALALTVIIMKSPGLERQSGEYAAGIIASFMVLITAIVAVRVVVEMPLDLGANWIFRVTPLADRARMLRAVRIAVYVMAAAPVWIVASVMLFAVWPASIATQHLTVMIFAGIALTETCLAGFHKLPFTCSYLPGKIPVHMAMLGYIGLVPLLIKVAEWEARGFLPAIATLAILAMAAWRRTILLARDEDAEVRFEEQVDPVILAINLHRDGVPYEA